MSIKERLFGPRWQHKDAEIRLAAVSQDNDPRLFEQLSTIAQQDADSRVRLAALRRLNHQSQWLKTSLNDGEEKLKKIANEWLIKHVCEQPAQEHLAERLAWLETVHGNDSIRQIAQSAQDAELRSNALSKIHAQGFLGDCFSKERDDAVASELLERIDQISTLKRIAEKLRKRNKDRYQSVLQRMAQMESGAANDATSTGQNELARQLLEQLEQLARGAASDNRSQKLEQIQQEWAQLPNPDEALVRRYNGALHILQLAMSERRKSAPEPEATASEPEANSGLTELTDRLHRLITHKPDTKKQDQIAQAVQTITADFDRAWNQIEPNEADHAVKQRFTALQAEYRSQSLSKSKQLKQSAQATETDPTPELMAQLGPALDIVDSAIEAGDVAQAQATLSSAQSLFDRLPGKRQAQEISGRLTRMHGRIKEIRNWQQWSTNELRERLIDRVGEIDVENLHPDAVTARLKELRERWKALDSHQASGDDKRRQTAPQGQWRRFQKAANDVYESARPYLEKRDEVRQQAHGELLAFMDEAEPLADNPATDRDVLIRYQRAARQVIRHLDSLPPKQRGVMASRLRGLMDGISKRLDAQFDHSEQEKRRLIAEARRLEHEKDRDVAIEQAKSLQAQWKKIPPARRKIDQQLWQEFREPIDPLFAGLKQEREQQHEQNRAQIEALEVLCKEAEQLAGVDEAELDNAAGLLAGLKSQWSEQSAPVKLNQRFKGALEKYQQRLAVRAEQEQLQKIAHLQQLTEALQASWNQRAAGKGIADQAELDIPESDATAHKLQGRLAEFSDPASDDSALAARVAGLTDRARQVTIEMEALSGLETPESDRKQRMDYQVQRLSERLGQGSARPDLEVERDELHRRWLESFPHLPEHHQELKKRFESGDKILKNMTSK